MFDEQKEEYSSKQNKNIPVWQSSKYVKAKEKAIELINKKDYGLTESDFWILKNETKIAIIRIITHSSYYFVQ